MIRPMVDSWTLTLPFCAVLVAAVVFMGVLIVRGLRAHPATESARLPTAGTGGGSLADRTRALCAAGDEAGAIVLVCLETGMTQDEAERFVQAIDTTAGHEPIIGHRTLGRHELP